MLLKINGIPDSVIETAKGAVKDVGERLNDFGSDYINMFTEPSFHSVGETIHSGYMVHTHILADTCDVAVTTGKVVIGVGVDLIQCLF
jgi:hypothetical protein